ncbi:MAG: hypothetical protein WC623_12235 [Pedobacter sp.]|uniref:hypothetical protein n=1 Tax=Pedobacter sp. TaxID=1411316 RepID=UPI0035648B8C
MEKRGYTVTNGAGRGPEGYLKPIDGGRKGGSYPDITAVKDGRVLRVNTVDLDKSGIITSREFINAARIRLQKPTEHLMLIKKQ